MLKLVSSLFFVLTALSFANTGYVIENYDIDIKINERNIYNVEEKIDTNFIEPRRGIYRVIPITFNGRRINITDIRANTLKNVENEGDYLAIRLGDPQITLRGLNKYIINYLYHLAWDRNPEYDEVYYNLVGNDWDTSIANVTFSIELPKEFDSSKINFTKGVYGSTNTEGVVWSVEGNTIKGYTTEPLNSGESLTLALPLPEGYFNVNMYKMIFYLIKGILFFIYLIIPIKAILLMRKYKDTPSVQSVEFYPPDNLTPSEIGYYIDGTIDAKDITSLIFYWADKGYLRINELNKGGLFSKEEFEIEFLKPLKTDKDFEKTLFNALSNYKNSENKLNIKLLKEKFYVYIEKTREVLEINLILNKKTLYEPKSLSSGINIRVASIFIIIGFFGYLFVVIKYFGITKSDILLSFWLGALSLLLTMIIGGRIRKKTKYGRDILGRIQGFKRFLETAEKRKIESLLEENPSYFYNILPYTIVLGVSKVWADKFKDLVVRPPEWYRGQSQGDAFVLGSFMRNFNNSFNTLNKTISSKPPAPRNSGGGSSSRSGGSSGGGAGGGGGRSW